MSRQPEPPPDVTLTAHPPERRRPARPVILPCGCCCCCCCCPHTIGGLAGGIAGSVTEMPEQPRAMDPDAPFPYRLDEFEDEGALVPAGLLYWLLVCLLIGVVVVWTAVANASGFGRVQEGLLIGGFIVLLVLPGLQLGASLLALLVILLFYPERARPLRRLGRITLWTIAGTLGGLIPMGACLLFFMR
jgi:hypothetical protein